MHPVLSPSWAPGPYSWGLSVPTSKMGLINSYFEGCGGRVKDEKQECLTQSRCSEMVSSISPCTQ